MWIVWFFVLPIVLVCFLVAGAIGLLVGTFHFWPIFLIGFGLWLLFRGGGRARDWDRRAWQPHPWPERRPAEPPRPPEPQPRPARPTRRPELPIDLQVKVEQIRRKVDVLLRYADRFPPFSHELYLVRQTAEDYLPRTINAFLSMPPEATDRPLAGHTKTARDELKAQLDLLDSKLDEIAQDLQRQDADRLLSNRRFLEDRFQAGDAGLPKTPAPEGGAPA